MKIILLIFFTHFLFISNAQLTENEGHVMLKYSTGKVDTAIYHNYAIGAEYIINRYIGLNYNFDLQFRNDRIRQFHTSIGALAGPPIIALGIVAAATNTDDEDQNGDPSFNLGALGILIGIVMLIAPDGVSFHLPVAYRWDISPYVNVLGVDYIRDKKIPRGYFKYAASFGLKGTYLQKNNFTFTAFAETRKVATMGWSIGGGLGIGYSFSPREVETTRDYTN